MLGVDEGVIDGVIEGDAVGGWVAEGVAVGTVEGVGVSVGVSVAISIGVGSRVALVEGEGVGVSSVFRHAAEKGGGIEETKLLLVESALEAGVRSVKRKRNSAA